jgi:hypothetical protein
MISYGQGNASGRAGLDHTANPYPPDAVDHDCWFNGWEHGRWVWAQNHAYRADTLTCPSCRAEGERIFVASGQEVWDPDGYVQPDSGRDEFDPPSTGAENMMCEGCHVPFEHRLVDPWAFCLVTDNDGQSPPAGIMQTVRRKTGFVYIVRSAGRVRIGKASSPQRYKSYDRALPHGCELLKVWEVSDAPSWESVLHTRYRKFRIHGSWYEIPEQPLQELLVLQPHD